MGADLVKHHKDYFFACPLTRFLKRVSTYQRAAAGSAGFCTAGCCGLPGSGAVAAAGLGGVPGGCAKMGRGPAVGGVAVLGPVPVLPGRGVGSTGLEN